MPDTAQPKETTTLCPVCKKQPIVGGQGNRAPNGDRVCSQACVVEAAKKERDD